MSCYSSVNDRLRKVDKTGSVERNVCTLQWTPIVYRNATEYLACKWSHMQSTVILVPAKVIAKLRKVTGISCSSVRRIAMRDLRLNVFECAPAGRVLTNRSSTSPLNSGATDWRQYSSEWWTHWTVVLNIWFICSHALLCNVSLCVLRTCVRFAIVYRALPWSCDKK